MNSMTGLIGAALLLAVLGVIGWLRRRRRSSRVTRLSSYSKSRGIAKMSCSFCKRKVPAKELSYYARHGKAIGVCKACRPQAERQALPRL
ncbi:hypothetical protein O9H85_09160 [Paenibacillus filicis]|uniref:LPXTG cell wall anchor domain-containing protein n=1 Tax=Paenibacillus gyeongsangnamensis TaxID=3388067 RepID=A0ABT4Q6T2_9BACL|nr:hypothetical protein [Paenibacillus filicis]MCZ8512577.1 hypothetical protein [Paenibacillus filicis]